MTEVECQRGFEDLLSKGSNTFFATWVPRRELGHIIDMAIDNDPKILGSIVFEHFSNSDLPRH
jgi:hypothetical protein